LLLLDQKLLPQPTYKYREESSIYITSIIIYYQEENIILSESIPFYNYQYRAKPFKYYLYVKRLLVGFLNMVSF